MSELRIGRASRGAQLSWQINPLEVSVSECGEDGKASSMNHAARRYAVASLTLGLVLGTSSANSVAQTLRLPDAANAVAMAGRITDARNLPIVGAVITARGSVVGWTATLHDGSFRLNMPAGSYELLVRKGGYTPSATSVLLSSGFVKPISLVLAEANLNSVNINTVRSSANAPFNTGSQQPRRLRTRP